MPRLEIHPLSELRAGCAALLAERHRRQRARRAAAARDRGFRGADPGGERCRRDSRRRRPSPTSSATVSDTRAEAGVRGLRGRRARGAARPLRRTWRRRVAVAAPAPVPASDAGADRRVVPARVRLPVRWRLSARRSRSSRSTSAARSGRARRTTSQAVAGFDRVLWAHQARSPSFSDWTSACRGLRGGVGRPVERRASIRCIVVAELDGRIVGHVLLYRPADGRPARPGAEHRPRSCGDARERPRQGRRPRAHRRTSSVGARARLPVDDDRLALAEPAVVALLAAPRLPAAVPAPLPGGPVMPSASTLALFSLAVDRARGRARAGRRVHRHAERRQGPARRASSRRSASRAAASCTSRPRRSGSPR